MITIFGDKTDKDFDEWWKVWKDIPFTPHMCKKMCKSAFITGKISESEDAVILRKQLEKSYEELDDLVKSLSTIQNKAYKKMSTLTIFMSNIDKQCVGDTY